jgi:hypothetical protein
MALRLKPVYGRREGVPHKYQVLGLPRDLEAQITRFKRHWSYLLIERGRDLQWKGNYGSPQDALTALASELKQLGYGE